jgi:hypothetical protein
MIEIIEVALRIVFHLFGFPGHSIHPEKSVTSRTDQQVPVILLYDIIDTR